MKGKFAQPPNQPYRTHTNAHNHRSTVVHVLYPRKREECAEISPPKPEPTDPEPDMKMVVLEERSGISDTKRESEPVRKHENPSPAPTPTRPSKSFQCPRMCADFAPSRDFCVRQGSKTPQDARCKSEDVRPSNGTSSRYTDSLNSSQKMFLVQNRFRPFSPVLPKTKDKRETTAARLSCSFDTPLPFSF